MEKLAQEVWRPCRNYGQKHIIKPGAYEVSSFGNVRRTVDGRSLCLEIRKYARVQLSTTNFCSEKRRSRSYPVHHLVYFAFHDDDEIGPALQIDHIDRNPLNNSIFNLRLCSRRKNAANKNNSTPRPGRAREVECLNSSGEQLYSFASASAAANHLGLKNKSITHIHECCSGLRKSAYGYMWRYTPAPSIENEVWTAVRGCENWQISSAGRARKGIGGKITVGGGVSDIGYARIKINGKNLLIHRLVMTHFGPPPPSPAHVVNHIDGNKANNYITNLEWLTQRENIIHGRQLRAGS